MIADVDVDVVATRSNNAREDFLVIGLGAVDGIVRFVVTNESNELYLDMKLSYVCSQL